MIVQYRFAIRVNAMPELVRAGCWPGVTQAVRLTPVVTFVNNTVDQTTGTIQLKATFANEANTLWPGQFVDVAMTVTSRTAIVVPSQSIQPGQQGPYVFIVKPDQTVESRLETPGARRGAETIVEKGVKSGERIVTDGQLRLVPGARIEARPAKAS